MPYLLAHLLVTRFNYKVISSFFRYNKSIEIYEEIAKESLKNNLLKYGVKGHLLNAGICHLCKGDVVSITNALEKYQVLNLLVSHYYDT